MEETTEAVPLRKHKDDGITTRYSATKRYSEILRDFDNLELSLVSSTSVDELLSDMDSPSLTEAADFTQDELMNEDVDSPVVGQDGVEKEGGMSAQDADVALCRSEGGVELALQYAKMWCRYAKDLLTWIDKKISLEQEFAKNILKAADTAKSTIAQQDLMPLQSIYNMALEQDMKCSASAKQTTELLQQRCYLYLSSKRNEIDKWRHEFKEQWAKEQKKMNDAVAALKRARQQYVQRCEELEKAKAMTAKGVDEASSTKTLDKRRKSQDDAQSKVTEAEALYKQCVLEAKAHQDELERVKERIIVHTRKLICQGDNVLKEVTVNMFYYQRQMMEPIPQSYLHLEQTCRPCEPGEPYLRYVFRNCGHEKPLQRFIFQEYTPQSRRNSPLSWRKVSNPLMGVQDSPAQDDARRGSDGRRIAYSDCDSMGGSQESLTSPAHGNKLPKAPSTGTVSSEDMDERDMGTEAECSDPLNESNGAYSKMRTTSLAALTHRLKKTKSKMSKCRQCDNFILVSGIECEECGFIVHRKCLDLCQTECERKRGSLFGVEFSMLPREQPQDIPFIVQRCTEEIESRALNVQGVYRVSGSKPRILKLVQAFEIQKDQVDLSDLSPHDITSVLKLFFKDLPDPLFTYDLYNDFITIGKEIQKLSEKNHTEETTQIVEDVVINLKQILGRLPQCNYSTLQHMMAHLYKISESFEENKMSPGNLGIVFGPTLLHPLVSGDVSMIALLESSYQALLVEFMISNYIHIFGPVPKPCNPPAPEPEPGVFEERGGLTRERPQSLESRTLRRDSSKDNISNKSSSSEPVDQLSPEVNDRAVLAMKNIAAASQGHPESPDAYMWTQPRSHFSRQPVKHPRQTTPTTKVPAADSQPAEDDYATMDEVLILAEGAHTSSSSLENITTIQTIQKINTSESSNLSRTGYASQTHSLPGEQRTQLDAENMASVTSDPSCNPLSRIEMSEREGQLFNKNTNQSNNNSKVQAWPNPQEVIQRHLMKDSTILSGLKLRRSNLRNGEPYYFV